MTAPAFRILALLACVGVAWAAQPTHAAATQTLDEVNVGAPEERERNPSPPTMLRDPNRVSVSLQKTIGVQLRFVREQTQVVFHRESAARRLPEVGDDLSKANDLLHLELLPDRLVAVAKPWMRSAAYLIDANVDEADGLPAQIPFGPDVVLLNLDHVALSDNGPDTSITLANAMHPQTRQCQRTSMVGQFWADGTSPYVLLGHSLNDCKAAVKAREGDLLFAANVPAALRQAVLELYDPIASRLSNRLGSEPGNIFVAWWKDAPHAGYRLESGWGRNSLLVFEGAAWEQGIDFVQRKEIRMWFMGEQIQRRMQSDWPGPFTQSAVSYLVSLTRNEEDHATARRLRLELPIWIAGCDSQLQARWDSEPKEDVTSVECGLVLQFVYDAVARSGSAGKQNIYDTWRELLDASFHNGKSGAKPADFLATSTQARRIARGLIEGNMDWEQFAAALAGVGVQLRAIPGAPSSAFEVVSLEHFQD